MCNTNYRVLEYHTDLIIKYQIISLIYFVAATKPCELFIHDSTWQRFTDGTGIVINWRENVVKLSLVCSFVTIVY